MTGCWFVAPIHKAGALPTLHAVVPSVNASRPPAAM
jgi:hypothetical protein